jgi:4a-hydroxytetrahydrobiopterin dehydratase
MHTHPVAHTHSVSARKASEPLAPEEARALAAPLKAWTAADGKTLRQKLPMKDFMAAVRFIDEVARAAEAAGHHPDVHLTGYRNLSIEISTHEAGALTRSDFLLAAKIDEIPRELHEAEGSEAARPAYVRHSASWLAARRRHSRAPSRHGRSAKPGS